jgi:transposase
LRRVDDVPNNAATRHSTGPKRIDWDAAEAFYLALDDRTYGQVAAKFSVSETSVGKQARLRKWREKAEKLDAEASERARRKVVRSRADQIAQMARIRDHAADRLERKLVDEQAELDDQLVIRALELSEKYVRLDAGEATDRVDRREVQQVILVTLRAATEFVPPALREAFLQRHDELMAGMPALGPGESEAA